MREAGEHWLAVGRMSNAARTELPGLGPLCDKFKGALLDTAIGDGGEFEQALQIPWGLVFSSLGSPDRPSQPGVRPHLTSSDGTFTILPTTCSCNRIWLEWLSSGNSRQWARKDLARRPAARVGRVRPGHSSECGQAPSQCAGQHIRHTPTI